MLLRVNPVSIIESKLNNRSGNQEDYKPDIIMTDEDRKIVKPTKQSFDELLKENQRLLDILDGK